MGNEVAKPLELSSIGKHLLTARLERGFTQPRLAKACGLGQNQISFFETGLRTPSLEQFIKLARALDVPLQRLLGGENRPGTATKELVFELRALGAVDLWVADAVVPGAARGAEEVIALAASGRRVEARLVETLPALLSWNELDARLLLAHAAATKTRYRLAWAADVALAIDRQHGFPGGCLEEQLERFIKTVGIPSDATPWDDINHPSDSLPASPIWRRWKIRFAGTLGNIYGRSKSLADLRKDLTPETILNLQRRARGLRGKRRVVTKGASAETKEPVTNEPRPIKVRRASRARPRSRRHGES